LLLQPILVCQINFGISKHFQRASSNSFSAFHLGEVVMR
jgi:hypothetical protein